MKELFRTHHISFKNAFAGVIWAFKTQPNFRIHALLSVFVLLAATKLQVQRIEYVLLIFAIVLGFTTEMLNTAVEAMTDLISTEWKKDAKIAKDVAAGMMLLTAFGTAIIAVCILYPYFITLFI